MKPVAMQVLADSELNVVSGGGYHEEGPVSELPPGLPTPPVDTDGTLTDI